MLKAILELSRSVAAYIPPILMVLSIFFSFRALISGIVFKVRLFWPPAVA